MAEVEGSEQSVRTLDNATAAIVEALSSSELVESVVIDDRVRETGGEWDRLTVCGHLSSDPSVRFRVRLEIS